MVFQFLELRCQYPRQLVFHILPQALYRIELGAIGGARTDTRYSAAEPAIWLYDSSHYP
jgi:hypothetical protein